MSLFFRGFNYINLDKILKCSSETIDSRQKGQILVIIDKIDTFVAGQEYDVQRKYIESLLEVDEDMEVSYPSIGRKIFLRSDLFERLNFESLGRDKVNDNTLRIKWHSNEILYFIGSRIINALEKEKILDSYDIIFDSSLGQDIAKYGILKNFIRFNNIIPMYIKKKFIDFDKLNEERNASLKEEFMKLAITKVFPHKIIHKNEKCDEEEIDIFNFFKTHFINATKDISPRNILIFLKQVNDFAISYYDENPDQDAHIVHNKNIPEWKLYKKNFIYKAYLESAKEFTRNIAKAQDKWSKYFSTFLQKRGRKQIFDYQWIRQQTDLDEIESAAFCSYLEYIGFVYISKPNADVKKRKYKVPIMYMQTCK